MPIFEYHCTTCNHRFELIVHQSTTPACPRCDGQDLQKEISVFAVGAASREAPATPGPCGRCGDPRGPGSCSLN